MAGNFCPKVAVKIDLGKCPTSSKGSLKKTVTVGKWSKPRLTPPPLPSLDSLTVTFFIVYLSLIDHDMYFEQNLYFSLTSGLTLRKFCVLPHVYTIKQSYIMKKMKNLSVKPTPLKIKIFLVFIMCFRAF